MASRTAAALRRAGVLLKPLLARLLALSLALLLGLLLALRLGLPAAHAASEAAPAVADPVLEAKVMAIATELRCLVCQNQTIADSHADLAVDLRRQIRGMLGKGMGEREVLEYMTQRYGDFVLYRPPLKPTTALLWAGPALLLAGGLAGLVLLLRRRQRMSPDAFDADTPEPPR